MSDNPQRHQDSTGGRSIPFVSVMAANADPTFRALVSYLARRTGLPITMLEGLPWSERQALLERGLASIRLHSGILTLGDAANARLDLLHTKYVEYQDASC